MQSEIGKLVLKNLQVLKLTQSINFLCTFQKLIFSLKQLKHDSCPKTGKR